MHDDSSWQQEVYAGLRKRTRWQALFAVESSQTHSSAMEGRGYEELWEMRPDRSVTAAGRGWMPGNTDHGLGRAP